MASESQEEKERFFRELDMLGQPNDEEDTSDAAAVLRSCRTTRKEAAGRRPAISPSTKDKSDLFKASKLNRTLSAPNGSTDESKRSETAKNKEPSLVAAHQPPPKPKQAPSFDKNTSVVQRNSTNSKSRMSAKRRREKSPKLVAESRQVFKDLVFFFIPNSDISQARRLRINKAREYGAVRAEVWNSSVTHVIVDQGLNFEAVMTAIPLKSFLLDIVLVNERYPSECLIFKALVDPTQPRFRVDGFSPAAAMNRSISLTEEKVNKAPPAAGQRKHRAKEKQTSVLETMPSETIVPSIEIHSGLDETWREAEDELEEVIGQLKAIADLPLDQDGDEETESSDIPEDNTSEEEHEKKKTKKSKETQEEQDGWRKNFICMQKHDGSTATANPNARTIEILDQMAQYYDRINDHWRTTAYRKAISSLRKQTERIATMEQALAIPFIGDRLASKIEEIVWKNRLRRLENIDSDTNAEVLQMFMQVYQAGYAVAQRWVAQGHRTLQDLVEKANLTENQLIGVEHFNDFLARIPRSEVEGHGKIVREAIHSIDPDVQVTIGGSFRRGATTSGDIDLIITKPNTSLDWMRDDLLLHKIIPRLFKKGFLKAGLATFSHGHGSKWHGASALPGSSVWRRIDFLLVPWEELGAALLYFTGNDIFNRSMRLLASKKGMRLNQHGLFKDVMRGPGRAKLNKGAMVEGQDERRIFEILGVPWRPPGHRNC